MFIFRPFPLPVFECCSMCSSALYPALDHVRCSVCPARLCGKCYGNIAAYPDYHWASHPVQYYQNGTCKLRCGFTFQCDYCRKALSHGDYRWCCLECSGNGSTYDLCNTCYQSKKYSASHRSYHTMKSFRSGTEQPINLSCLSLSSLISTLPSLTPLTNLSAYSAKYKKVAALFKTTWTKGDASKWSVQAIIAISNDSLVYKFNQYCRQLRLPNVQKVWHGTKSECGFPSQQTDACMETSCPSCNISQKGFLTQFIRKNSYQRFGTGFYFGYNSSKAADYPLNDSNDIRTMLLCKVAAGVTYCSAEDLVGLTQAPLGYHSVTGVVGNRLNYPELVVYNEDAILPKFIVVFKKN